MKELWRAWKKKQDNHDFPYCPQVLNMFYDWPVKYILFLTSLVNDY